MKIEQCWNLLPALYLALHSSIPNGHTSFTHITFLVQMRWGEKGE
jgi:hypothetical protein